jgi:hypothetical protein
MGLLWLGLQRVGANPQASAPLDGTPLFLAHPAPDPSVLTGLEGPLEAVIDNRAAPADRLSLLNLKQGRSRRPDRKEQLGILVSAGGTVAPVHGGNTP